MEWITGILPKAFCKQIIPGRQHSPYPVASQGAGGLGSRDTTNERKYINKGYRRA